MNQTSLDSSFIPHPSKMAPFLFPMGKTESSWGELGEKGFLQSFTRPGEREQARESGGRDRAAEGFSATQGTGRGRSPDVISASWALAPAV